MPPPATAGEDGALPGPAEITGNYVEVAQRASRLLSRYIKRKTREGAGFPATELVAAKAFMDFSARLLASPYRLAQTQMDVMRDHVLLWQQSMLRAMGMPFRSVARPDENDSRFRDPAWEENFLFDFIKQSYLITTRHLDGVVATLEGLDEDTRRRVNSLTQQYIESLSPTNFVLTNPEVLRETVHSRGRNLINGLKNLLKDLEAGHVHFRAPLANPATFRLGKDLATTQGKVIFQNELLQLIQYAPTTARQYRIPLLIVPPWTNKYYLFDLRDDNSFVRWTTDQGFTTFMISWVNPDAALAHKTFEDYLADGLLAAINAIEQATGEHKLHLAGYCLGGTLVMSTLACMAARQDTRAASGSFLGSMIDFSAVGESASGSGAELPVMLGKRKDRSANPKAPQTTATYQMLRANELIWAFVVNNYLLSRTPFPTDLMYWNADAMRVPARMHPGQLQKSRQADGRRLLGVNIDIAAVKVPCYFLATVDDHVSPWRRSYLDARTPSGAVRFVLGGSGHIAGIVNPPSANRHGYWTNDGLPELPDDFLAGAAKNLGSWWTDWRQWLLAQPEGAALVAARTPGEGALKVLEDAPGSYVQDAPAQPQSAPG